MFVILVILSFFTAIGGTIVSANGDRYYLIFTKKLGKGIHRNYLGPLLLISAVSTFISSVNLINYDVKMRLGGVGGYYQISSEDYDSKWNSTLYRTFSDSKDMSTYKGYLKPEPILNNYDSFLTYNVEVVYEGGRGSEDLVREILRQYSKSHGNGATFYNNVGGQIMTNQAAKVLLEEIQETADNLVTFNPGHYSEVLIKSIKLK